VAYSAIEWTRFSIFLEWAAVRRGIALHVEAHRLAMLLYIAGGDKGLVRTAQDAAHGGPCTAFRLW
jgi:hypothetical protein